MFRTAEFLVEFGFNPITGRELRRTWTILGQNQRFGRLPTKSPQRCLSKSQPGATARANRCRHSASWHENSVSVFRPCVRLCSGCSRWECSAVTKGAGTIVESVRWPQMLLEPSLAIVAIERDMLSEVWEARNAIETETARLAALRRTEDDLNALTAITSPRQAMGLPPTKRITA